MQHKNLWIPLFIFVIFASPVIAAVILYSSGYFVPATVNAGQLISPPQSLMHLKLQDDKGKTVQWRSFVGKWYLLYLNPNDCDQLCAGNLYKMRQIRLALGKNIGHVDRMVVTFIDTKTPVLKKLLTHGFQGTLHLQSDKSSIAQLLDPLSSKEIAMTQGNLYLVDPLGNLIMSYAPTQDPSGILKDLKRLLSVSQIG